MHAVCASSYQLGQWHPLDLGFPLETSGMRASERCTGCPRGRDIVMHGYTDRLAMLASQAHLYLLMHAFTGKFVQK